MTILIVESSAPMRKMLRQLLQSAHPDCLILEADAPEVAVEMCKRCRPRLVLVDAMLAQADGIAFIARVKALLPNAPIIVVSQDAAGACARRALDAGAYAYVLKNRRYRELPPTIASALRPKLVSVPLRVPAEIVRAH